MRTRAHPHGACSDVRAALTTLASLPDDTLLQVIAACTGELYDVPLFDAVKGLACISKGMRQQLHRLQPLVGVRSLAVMQRPAHGPWRVMLLYYGELTEAVMEQARQGRVHSIDANPARKWVPFAPAEATLVVPELLGAGCSLIELDLSFLGLYGTWAATFGEAAVCSAVLRRLHLRYCGLQGPLPELRLPALQELHLNGNQVTGGLEPLSGCTGLTKLLLYANHFLTGGLEPLQGCTALQTLDVGNNKLTGGLEPLRACTALQTLDAGDNKLTGGFEALRSCKALEVLRLNGNLLTGGLEPLRGCTALRVLFLQDNQLDATDEDKAHLEQQCRIFLA